MPEIVISTLSLIISFLSLLATVAVSFVIYWFQKSHQEEIEKRDEQRRQDFLKLQARQFIIDNADEIDRLPLCVIAASTHPYAKHRRRIYTAFNRTDPDVQSEILRQQNIPIKIASGAQWVGAFIQKLDADISEYGLGHRSWLYDGAKYLHRAFTRYSCRSTKNVDNRIIDLSIEGDFLSQMKSSLGDYVFLYLEYKLNLNDDDYAEKKLRKTNYVPPNDLLFSVWQKSEEAITCFWTMEMVMQTSIVLRSLHLTQQDDAEWRELFVGSDLIETFEDKYYLTLLALYTAYADSSEI